MKKNLLGLVFVVIAIFALQFSPTIVLAQGGLPAGYVETMSGGQYKTDSSGRVVSTAVSDNAGFAACSNIKNTGVSGIVACIMAFFNTAVYLLIAAGVVYVMYGAFKLISAEEGREEAKQTIYYGIIGLFVMVSIWGLVNILENTFRLSGGNAPAAPQFVKPN